MVNLNGPGIYLIKCISSGKLYVGSSKHVSKRVESYYAKNSNDMYKKEFKQLKDDGFKIEVIQCACGLTKNELLSLELFWILKLRTYCPFGMNIINPVTNKKF